MTTLNSETREHKLKCWPEFYDDVESGRKPFEIQKNDRDYKVGDLLLIRWFDPQSSCYSGRQCVKVITYITDWEQKDGFVVLGISEALSRARSVPEGEPGLDFKDIVEQFLAKATEEELRALLDTDEMRALAKDKTPWLQWAAEYSQQQALSSRIPSGELGEGTVEHAICEEIKERREKGLAKYGVGVERTDLSLEQWLQHAKEEAMDFAIYLERIKRKLAENAVSPELGELLKALKFYADSWIKDTVGTGEIGSTMTVYEPMKQLLDDAGQRASDALRKVK